MNTNPWVGSPFFFVKIGQVVVYPHGNLMPTTLGVWVDLGFSWIQVRMGEEMEVWVQSSSALDGVTNVADACVEIEAITKMEEYTTHFI